MRVRFRLLGIHTNLFALIRKVRISLFPFFNTLPVFFFCIRSHSFYLFILALACIIYIPHRPTLVFLLSSLFIPHPPSSSAYTPNNSPLNKTPHSTSTRCRTTNGASMALVLTLCIQTACRPSKSCRALQHLPQSAPRGPVVRTGTLASLSPLMGVSN